MLQPGQQIGNYLLLDWLGQGGMATVYKARHATLGSLHAIKVLQVQSDGAVERLIQEGRVQARLRHTNIVAVTDVVEVAGQTGLVMEYVDGPNLQDHFNAGRPDLDEALRLFRGVVAGVQEAHGMGVVHRDLKPANVLLERVDEGWEPRVADFGLVKWLEESTAVLHHTRGGMAMGTAGYMAPEQFRDAAQVDQRADVYALGCMLYWLTTGQRPFTGADLPSVMFQVMRGAFMPPRHFVPDLPDAVDLAIRGCLVVDRERRIQSCAALLGVLDGDAFEAPETPTAPTEPLGNLLAHADTWSDSVGTSGPVVTATRTKGSVPSLATLELPEPVPTRSAPAREQEGRPRSGVFTALAIVLVAVAALLIARPSSDPGSPAPVLPRTSAAVSEAAQDLQLQTEVAPESREQPPVARQPSTPPATARAVELQRPAGSESEPKTAKPAASAPPRAPVQPAPATATVRLEGDAISAWLQSGADGPRVSFGHVPAGRYTIHADFGDGKPILAGEVSLSPGVAVTVRCVAMFGQCE